MAKRIGVRAPAIKDRDHDIEVSTVKFLNVKKVEKQVDLINLLTHIIQQHSKQQSVLVQAKTSPSTIEYSVRNRRVAITMAKHVQRAFKHHHPDIHIAETKDRRHCAVTVTFNS